MGVFQITSRLGAASAPWVAQWLTHFHGPLPFLLMGGLAISAAVVSFALSETKDVETAEELPWKDKNEHRKDKNKEMGGKLVMKCSFCLHQRWRQGFSTGATILASSLKYSF